MDQTKYAELFRTESREHLAELDDALLALEARDASRNTAAIDAAHISTLFRNTHSIKGMAGAMGYRVVERIAHALESLLDDLRSGQAIDVTVLTLLFDGSDAMRGAIDDASNGRATHESDTLRTVLQRLTEAQSRDVDLDGGAPLCAAIGVGAMLLTDDPAVPAAEENSTLEIDVRLTHDCPLKGVRALLILGRINAVATVHALSPLQHTWQDESFDGRFSVILTTTATADEVEATVRAAGDVLRVTSRVPEPATSRGAGEALRTVRIDLRRLDTLLELVGELVITRDRLLRVADAAVEQGANRAIARAAHDTARLISTLQDEVLQARMVPIGQVFDRFPRLVRDIARDLHKDVEFVTEGREIELDRSLLDAIGEPILHLLRNALDHGLEDAATRRSANKPPRGQLILRAARDRGAVVIQVEDDGRGIDRSTILTRARSQGILSADVTRLDDDQLLHVLAHPGFSTAHAVTSISGRGVGVDVVSTRVRALGGSLTLETLEGLGTAFTLRLPVTLAITRALLVQVGDGIYAIPAAQIVEALQFEPDTKVAPPEHGIVQRPARETVRVRGETLPVLRLRDRFDCGPNENDSFVTVVEISGRRTAVVVDALIGQQDVVVKRFDAPREGAPWFSGATVLGDGTPSLIVDLSSLC